MPEDYEYDEERALWRPGRRSFLFMLGGAVAGLVVPKAPIDWIPDGSTVMVATKDYADMLVETFSRDRVFAPFERDMSAFKREVTRNVLSETECRLFKIEVQK